ncbi:MAG: hypothetical protein AAF716_10575 [Cyanobacteria bacterium P01_D01_bin.1]
MTGKRINPARTAYSNREALAHGIDAEHAFGGIKRYKAAADIYRNRKKDF